MIVPRHVPRLWEELLGICNGGKRIIRKSRATPRCDIGSDEPRLDVATCPTARCPSECARNPPARRLSALSALAPPPARPTDSPNLLASLPTENLTSPEIARAARPPHASAHRPPVGEAMRWSMLKLLGPRARRAMASMLRRRAAVMPPLGYSQVRGASGADWHRMRGARKSQLINSRGGASRKFRKRSPHSGGPPSAQLRLIVSARCAPPERGGEVCGAVAMSLHSQVLSGALRFSSLARARACIREGPTQDSLAAKPTEPLREPCCRHVICRMLVGRAVAHFGRNRDQDEKRAHRRARLAKGFKKSVAAGATPYRVLCHTAKLESTGVRPMRLQVVQASHRRGGSSSRYPTARGPNSRSNRQTRSE